MGNFSDLYKQYIAPQYMALSASGSNANTFISGVTGTGVGPSASPIWRGEVHRLHIINHADDHGQDGYIEDYDWKVEHDLSKCERKLETLYALEQIQPHLRPISSNLLLPNYGKLDEAYVFDCPMAEELDRYGLQNFEMDWQSLEEGVYSIRLEQGYSSYTTGYGKMDKADTPMRIRLV
jgi:hypothetical protein